jgi:hypothetical protein
VIREAIEPGERLAAREERAQEGERLEVALGALARQAYRQQLAEQRGLVAGTAAPEPAHAGAHHVAVDVGRHGAAVQRLREQVPGVVRLVPERPDRHARELLRGGLGEAAELAGAGAVHAGAVAAAAARGPAGCRWRERQHYLEAARASVGDERLEAAPAGVLRRVGGVEAGRLAAAARGDLGPVQLRLDHVHAEAADLLERRRAHAVAALQEELVVLEERNLAHARARRRGEQRERDEDCGCERDQAHS